jgi:hypothetical protein
MAVRPIRSIRPAASSWGKTLPVLGLSLLLSACGQQARVIRETPSSGVVVYPFQQEGDRLSSAARSEAVNLIEQKCGGRSHVVREGEVPRVRGDVDLVWRGQMSGDRLWGIEFTCE